MNIILNIGSHLEHRQLIKGDAFVGSRMSSKRQLEFFDCSDCLDVSI